MLKKITPAMEEEFEAANRDNAELVVDVARALVPVGETARARSAIKNVQDGKGQIVDFGPLSKILEGGTAERFTKDGQSRGRGPKLPFARPALAATKTKRAARNRKAVKAAIRVVKNGG